MLPDSHYHFCIVVNSEPINTCSNITDSAVAQESSDDLI